MRRIGLCSISVFLLLFVVSLIGARVARADSIVYTLTGSTNPAFGPVHAEGFQFTAPNFVTSALSLSASQLDSCVACSLSGTALQFFPNGSVSTIIPVDYFAFTDASGIVYGFFFAPGAFSAPGTYTASSDLPFIISNICTLTVQATPEPSSLLLLLAGVLGLAGAVQIKKLLLS
jgi:hypothetical protein